MLAGGGWMRLKDTAAFAPARHAGHSEGSGAARRTHQQRIHGRISLAGRAYNQGVHLSIEIDREDDGRWIAEALELPGVMTYGQTREEAISNTERLAIEVIADRIKHAELPPSALNVSFQVLSEQLTGD